MHLIDQVLDFHRSYMAENLQLLILMFLVPFVIVLLRFLVLLGHAIFAWDPILRMIPRVLREMSKIFRENGDAEAGTHVI